MGLGNLNEFSEGHSGRDIAAVEVSTFDDSGFLRRVQRVSLSSRGSNMATALQPEDWED